MPPERHHDREFAPRERLARGQHERVAPGEAVARGEGAAEASEMRCIEPYDR